MTWYVYCQTCLVILSSFSVSCLGYILSMRPSLIVLFIYLYCSVIIMLLCDRLLYACCNCNIYYKILEDHIGLIESELVIQEFY